MQLQITFGVPENQKLRVAQLLYEAFEKEFRTVFGSREQSVPLISKYLRNDRTVVALYQDIVVGVGGLKFDGYDFFDASFWQLLRALKFGIFRLIFFGWLFNKTVEDKGLLIDTLAVIKKMRGKGIGTQLVNFIIIFARSQGYTHVKLFVEDLNEKAKKLYERIGFQEEQIHRIPFPWNQLLGFNTTCEMVYCVVESDNKSLYR